MKKMAVFALSLGGSLLLFLTVAVICVAIWFLRLPDTPETANHSEIKVSQNTNEYEVLAVYRDDHRLLAACVFLDATDKSVWTETVELSDFSEIDRNSKNIFIFNQNIFAEIADRCGGLVYNNYGGGVLLTGAQAVDVLDGVYFAEFCRQIFQKALNTDTVKFFSYLANNTENNFSFPELYDALY